MHHLPESQASSALGEFARVLKPGGVLGLAVEEGASHRIDALGRYRKLYTASTLQELLGKSGFQIVDVQCSESLKDTLGETRPKRWLQVFATRSHGPFPAPVRSPAANVYFALVRDSICTAKRGFPVPPRFCGGTTLTM